MKVEGSLQQIILALGSRFNLNLVIPRDIIYSFRRSIPSLWQASGGAADIFYSSLLIG